MSTPDEMPEVEQAEATLGRLLRSCLTFMYRNETKLSEFERKWADDIRQEANDALVEGQYTRSTDTLAHDYRELVEAAKQVSEELAYHGSVSLKSERALSEALSRIPDTQED